VRVVAVVVIFVLCACLAVVAHVGATPAVPRQQVDQPEVHDPPVDAPVIDPFRAPAGPYAPGNRGLEYDTIPGQIVRSSSDGVVTFSGQVGGNLFVTVRHSASLRTTVGFVESTSVQTGDIVVKGQPIAIAGHNMHFTARRDGQYIDPALLFQHFRVIVRLVPGPTG